MKGKVVTLQKLARPATRSIELAVRKETSSSRVKER